MFWLEIAPTSAAANPFAVLSLIVAPAVLTNASSVLIMSTSNRLARAADRARTLAAELEQEGAPADARSPMRLRELTATEERALLLLRALRQFYTALGGFASAALLSLVGAVIFAASPVWLTRSLEVVAVAAGLWAVVALVLGSLTLLRETRIAVDVLHERAAHLREVLGDLGPD